MPMNRSKNIPDKATSSLTLLTRRIIRLLPDKGFFVLLGTVALLAFLASYDFSPKNYIVNEGDVAAQDIMADRNIFIEDKEATQQKQEKIRAMQPLVCDLVLTPITTLRTQVQEIFIAVNQADEEEDFVGIQQQLDKEQVPGISLEEIQLLRNLDVQVLVMDTLVPFLQDLLSQGVLDDMRAILSYRGGILVNDVQTGTEKLILDVDSIRDIKSIENLLSQKLSSLKLPAKNKRALSDLLMLFMAPTLTPNYGSTQERTEQAVEAVVPVVYSIDVGEIIVRQGEKVTKEQQIKIQALWKKQTSKFNREHFVGIIVLGSLFASGLLFSPSGRRASPMTLRDFIFISVLITLFSLIAKSLYLLGTQLELRSASMINDWISYVVPVVGASALASLIFSTRRYLVTGLLLAFFCTLMVKGGLTVFVFYFLSAMWGTWLTSRTQSRQDLVKSILPMCVGLYAMWLGCSLLDEVSVTRLGSGVLAVGLGALFSIILTLALAPVVEMLFNYTTRFRLMELMNMEQPLLRDLMLNAPGTYHHSLIVSNMVEAGAEKIGAYSLLCKVAALYHDIGKVSKANYFIENQTTEDNPHDRLTPSMSALILTSHVKQGVELAEQHRLGKEVIDIIRQHHGNGVIRFFYHKAMQQAADGVPPKIEDFSYAGPKPQTKEAALVMLADVVEASSRTLVDPTPTKLRLHIHNILKAFYADGQLDETDLTFRDLEELTDSFQRILRGIFHHRIVYPEKQAKNAPPPMGKSAIDQDTVSPPKTVQPGQPS